MNKKTVLIVDAGGRGAALVDAYAKSEHVEKILAVPGNDLMGIYTQKKVITFANVSLIDTEEILRIAKTHKVDLVNVGHENALAPGLADLLEKNKIPVVGPTKKACQIEWDKAWAREFMTKYKLPRPKYKIFNSQKRAIEFIKKQKDSSWFVKAYGLVEGKGALPAQNNQEAIEKVKEMTRFGKDGKIFLLEEWLVGEEFSTFALCDGKSFQIVQSAQDHKRAFDGDKGENTGGMGTSSPPLVITKAIQKQIADIFSKTIKGLKKEKRIFKGVLYLGGIVVKENKKPKVYIIEFNARWGDPEIEVILPGIQNDFYELSIATIESKLNKIKIKTDKKARVAIAGASKGYPKDYSEVLGKRIFGLNKVIKNPNVRLYGAAVKKKGDTFTANGGRLFYIVASGTNVIEARKHAYKAMSQISIEGKNLHFRKDIGWRDIERIKQKS